MIDYDSPWREAFCIAVWLTVGLLAGLYLGQRIFEKIKPAEPVETRLNETERQVQLRRLHGAVPS